MKRLAILLIALCLLSGTAFSASTMTESWHEQGHDRKYQILKLALVAHTDGTFTTVAITAAGFMNNLTTDPQRKYYLTEVYADPGATTPTNGSSIQIQHSSFGTPDVMEGGMAGLSNATSARFTPPVRPVLVFEQLKIAWSGNSVNGGLYDLYLIFERW